MDENEQPIARKSKRGFASMSRERIQEIAALGGKKAHSLKRAHIWDSTTAQAAGRKGGATVAKISGHMSAIGKMGGSAPHRNRASRVQVAATVESGSV